MVYYIKSADWKAQNLICAEVSEWFKEPVLKTGDSAMGRGFESHPLRFYRVGQNRLYFFFIEVNL